MTLPPLHLPTILRRMADQSIICSSAVHLTVQQFGESPKPNRRTMIKALQARGTIHYRHFMQEWLGWPPSLTTYLHDLEDRTRWPSWRSKIKHLTWSDRSRLIEEQHIAATLAYIAEIKKP